MNNTDAQPRKLTDIAQQSSLVLGNQDMRTRS